MRAVHLTKRCSECGDDIPYYSRICPYCYYDSQEDGRYDHSSSPYLMMMDLKGLVQELVKLERVGCFGGVVRWLAFREVDPHWERVVEIETTYRVVYELVICRYGRMRTVVESIETFEDIFAGELYDRRRNVERVKRYGRVVMSVVVALLVLMIGCLILKYNLI